MSVLNSKGGFSHTQNTRVCIPYSLPHTLGYTSP